MKVIFICGCLEPGKDGVGDYTRRLAGELVRQGDEVSIVALKDHFVSECEEGLQFQEGVHIPVLRCGKEESVVNLIIKAKEWIEKRDPDWLSLQYGLFSFQDKGLPWLLGRRLKILGKRRKWQIMFHELWIGVNPKNKLKTFILSRIQKLIIRDLLSVLQPRLIHTNIPLHKIKLEAFHLKVRNLPLFSNIKTALVSEQQEDQRVFRIGFFSQAALDEPIVQFLGSLNCQAHSLNLQLEVILIGGKEEKMKMIGRRIEDLSGYLGRVKCKGHLPSDELSKALRSCSIGITPVPVEALGKSGSVAAFLGHGVPVAAPIRIKRKGIPENGFFCNTWMNAILLEPNLANLNIYREAALVVKGENSLSKISSIFKTDLEEASVQVKL
jgi:glycosyltransferase involved in cell wall biosynthesis